MNWRRGMEEEKKKGKRGRGHLHAYDFYTTLYTSEAQDEREERKKERIGRRPFLLAFATTIPPNIMRTKE